METISQQLREHTQEDRHEFAKIHDVLSVIKENHLAHIQADMATLKADTKWQTWLLRLAVAGVLAGFIERLYQILHP